MLFLKRLWWLFVLLSCCELCSTGVEEFLPFGAGTGDTVLATDSGVLILDTPFVFYNSPETDLYINSDGLISFKRPLTNTAYNAGLNITLPHQGEPGFTQFLAPFWSSLTIQMGGGIISYRNSTNSSLIGQAQAILSADNTDINNYSPRLLVVATWSAVTLSRANDNQNVTFQVLLLTDGTRSFSVFLYGHVAPEADYLIGFNAGDRRVGVVLATSEEAGQANTALQTMAFRTDGLCVTYASQACQLNSFSIECSAPPSLAALSCNCSIGYRDNNSTCEDIDECAEAEALGGTICPMGGSSDCVNLDGSYHCPCRSAFFGNNLTVCEDKDECSVGLSSCDANAECNNTFGGFVCSCNPGFFGNGNVCIRQGDLVPCVEGPGGANCSCMGEGSSRQCSCDRGFNTTTSISGECRDVDECAAGTAPCNQICLNTEGSYLCVCLPGFHLAPDGFSCQDIDECRSRLHDCDSASGAECTNNEGSFTCQCRAGLSGDGRVCFEDDVCEQGSHGCEQLCIPTDPQNGYFRCICLPGYLLGRDTVSCQDLDECESGLHNCNINGDCTNTVGSFQCSCRDGFYGSGIICQDIDECALRLDDCGARNCTNIPGGFNCSCPANFFPLPSNPEQCTQGTPPDINVIPVTRPISQFLYSIGNDFCLENVPANIFADITINLLCQPLGNIFPDPSTTWTLRVDDRFTHDIVFEKEVLPGMYNDTATINNTHLRFGPIPLANLGLDNLEFRFECLLSNSIGEDSDRTIIRQCEPSQCQDGITNNCESLCKRNGTNYSCSCEQGFRLAEDEVSCDDVDECSPGDPTHNCSRVSTFCNNIDGGFTCECLPGFLRQSDSQTSCEDIDECSQGLDICSQQPQLTKCENLLGNFTCVCPDGFLLAEDEVTCMDINECISTEFQINCSSLEICVNGEGSFQCDCIDGYGRGADGGCEDIDECSNTLSPCLRGDCTNRNGSFNCSCMEGMSLDNDMVTCSDIDECAASIDQCGANSKCVNTLGSFVCSCSSLFRRVGNDCELSLSFLIPVILVGCVILFIAIFLVICAIFLVSRRKLKQHYSKQMRRMNNTYILTETQRPHPPLSSAMELSHIPKSLMISIGELSFDNKVLGSGEFGIVHRAKYRNEFVAVKTLKGFFDDSSIVDLVEEILKMKDFSHLNVLTLMGVALDSRHSPCLVTPFMSNGSLCEYLRKGDVRKELLWEREVAAETLNDASRKLTNFCWQIAKGMEYLTSKKVIHRDLAARNCMLDMNLVIKVADFGLSVSMAEDKNYFRAGIDSAEKLPVKWMAPESLSDRKFSELSDVWAFGVTCWEVFSCGKVPYPTVKATELLLEITKGYVMDQPENGACTDTMYLVMRGCWAHNPNKRPGFSTLVVAIGESLAENADYFTLIQSSKSPLSSLLKAVVDDSAVLSNHANQLESNGSLSDTDSIAHHRGLNLEPNSNSMDDAIIRNGHVGHGLESDFHTTSDTSL